MARFGKKSKRPKATLHRTAWPRIREIVIHGRTFFQVDPRPHAKRETFAALVRAKTRAEQLAKDRGDHGKKGLLAPIKDRVLLAEMQTVVSRYGKTIRDAIAIAVRVWEEDREREASVPMSQALDEWLESKERIYRAGKLRLRTIQSIRPLAGEFRAAFGHLNVLTLSPEMIKASEDGRPLAPRTVAHKRAALSEFFRFCILRDWRRDNPVEKLHALAPIESKRVSVSILVVEDCKDLLTKASEDKNAGELVPYIAVALFAGLRPSEAERLDWKQIHFETRQIEVLADTSKNAENRFVPIEGNALAWLKKYRQGRGLVVGEANWRRKWDNLRIAAGYALRGEKGRQWSDDVLRHSYASYWLSVNPDRARLAEQMGNSVEVIRSHYRRAIPPEVAKAFWNLVCI